ncbi:MAG: phosphomethylpyrimidine synthase ThiC [Proteobacteria bacterium]|nr:phosphomethylpyrimidine synthase ThiC [Pseudomonadota bacterium]MBU4469659.1 phosphomethylpyrimidine synthase ThiC [Pseudomonadota bacterium]
MMATQLSKAKEGVITDEMRQVAADEGFTPVEIRDRVAAGLVVIPKNINHSFSPKGIGDGLSTKINANIGTSMDHVDLDEELEKMEVAVRAGADSVMDLSTGGDLKKIRNIILKNSPVMLGAVPIYGAASELAARKMSIKDLTADLLFDTIEQQCEEGLDYITVHCGVTQSTYSLADQKHRIAGIVSRGGALLSAWMHYHNRENPLYEEYDRLLQIAFKYDVTLSLGDGLRPGSVADATDKAQLKELIVIGELTKRARDAGVQVIVEGPGHVPLNQIEANILIQKRICDNAPFYVLGPLTTDCAPGYDHITAAIGGAIAAAAGADFLCYVTPAEHLCLPDIKDVEMGVIAAKIAAHSGDIAKGVRGAMERNIEMSICRKRLDWEGMYRLALDPVLARQRRSKSENAEKEVCTMCGELCAVNIHNNMCTKEQDEQSTQ